MITHYLNVKGDVNLHQAWYVLGDQNIPFTGRNSFEYVMCRYQSLQLIFSSLKSFLPIDFTHCICSLCLPFCCLYPLSTPEKYTSNSDLKISKNYYSTSSFKSWLQSRIFILKGFFFLLLSFFYKIS